MRGGKAAGICNISAVLLKGGGEAMIRGLHAVLTAVWHSGTISPDWKKGLVISIWKEKGDGQMYLLLDLRCFCFTQPPLGMHPHKKYLHILI